MAGDRTLAGRAVSRRDILRCSGFGFLALSSAVVIAGCDIRLEDDAPSIPLLQRKSIPDEAFLVDAVRRTTTVAQLAGRVAKPSEAVTKLGSLHRTQADVLRARLREAGVPNHVIDAPTATDSPSAAVSAPPSATPADVASAESAAVNALLPGLPSVTPANHTVLASVVSACAAGVEQLGAPVTWPAADPLPSPAAVTLLSATRAAAYAFQVVAAQTTGDMRAVATSTHTTLDLRGAELAAMAGSAAPPAPLGYALPFPVTSPDAAGKLAVQVLTSLVAGGLAPLDGLPAGSNAVTTLVRLLVGSTRLARSWAVEPVPFPGMAYP